MRSKPQRASERAPWWRARVLLPAPLVGVLATCLYGFTTTFEPMDAGARSTWRVAYAAGGLVSLLLLALLLAASIRADARRHVRCVRSPPRPPARTRR